MVKAEFGSVKGKLQVESVTGLSASSKRIISGFRDDEQVMYRDLVFTAFLEDLPYSKDLVVC